ncbi:poly-beta-1,6-N-acetyl-D-glucosamine N-deacetylase PgaB [Burkholderia ambifaria AMMD]|uniref:Polysaccharide deacetylase n=1 Tax=Burkholderia ambifaria (strain ATCC BAA-244 / DSM 16087 / CCUG 44356 / LMG 19182 / AMMD) TaxID=339670 RepID=Q0B9V5_BURCM|nr:poly-beta-1,6-N-acetyl-D-glucosamine N-deacetylase PgaB [Burkholderia ambifaria]ABI89068.1 polysaccharide deacetylase [Burkholderia ambifaria AMMD]AJY24222.1 poly-beta-1,6-N-acetyl-D-glucosamine N-deacetylase PgaB [Burkholderia ambifaria AMMD]MBR7930976.1 poly-beta-1,6-N-acetyl-D-glucosamine N-deacetylase PgaB [Burkholderia ambifaria]PEH69354.1 poly-beta-1,6-N-acetyl-D-glucosamine N-deacetylase PgaB [Burkholderia ambifaria]QQC06049.1 poly-beta-1,6-N-acetyl-D-glucosamine N-deacetylase PgaB [
MQSRRTFMCGCMGAFAACSLFPGVSNAKMIDLLPPSDPADGKTFRVICLHDVRDNLMASFTSPSAMVDPFAVDTGTLTAIFSWLQTNNYHTITVKQIEESRHGGKPLPPRSVLLTFDDGFRSHYTKVLPLLERFKYPAVMGIVTAWIDTPPNAPIRISDKVQVPRDYFLSWDEVKKLGQSHLVELGCHTHNLHHGAIANPQGNELPATTSHLYLQDQKRYETDAEFEARVHNDLQTCVRQIREHTGIVARSMVWPYGAENQPVRKISTSLGMDIQFSLDAGPNTPDVPLDRLRRILMMYDVDIGGFERSMREPASNRGDVDVPERTVQVDLDQVYDPDPARQEANLGKLIERIYRMQPKSVYLQAYADPKGTGVAEAVYFPNRHLPMRSDLFSRAAWQLNTRANVQVYAWMPVLAFRPPADKQRGLEAVSAYGGAPARENGTRVFRLSPFDPEARLMIQQIYEDLTKHASFSGILFGDDAVLDDYEDAGKHALRTYSQWGLPADIGKIRENPDLMKRWTRQKSRYLVDLTRQLSQIVLAHQNAGDVLTARNIFAMPVLKPESEAWYAQNYDDFLATYDYVALMAMPYMEQAKDPESWLDQLVQAVHAKPRGLERTVFELQSYDWRARKEVPANTLLAQMRRLRSKGAVNFGYYPDNFLNGQPQLEAMRDVMSLKSRLDQNSINALMQMQHTPGTKTP